MLKRILDIILSFFGIIIFSPVFIVIAIIIKITSNGSIFLSKRGLDKMLRYLKCSNLELCCNNSEFNTISVLGDERITPVWSYFKEIQT